MNHLKIAFMTAACLFTMGCSIPYWIKLSYTYKHDNEQECVQRSLKLMYKTDTYYLRFGGTETHIIMDTDGQYKQAHDDNKTINIRIESDRSAVTYLAHWTGAQHDIVAYMANAANKAHMERILRERFAEILDQCVADHTIACTTRGTAQGQSPSCVDE
jgi:hypothetical protein